MADQPLSGIAVEDIGKTALGIFKRGTEFIGQTISIAGDHLTGDQYAAALTEARRRDVGLPAAHLGRVTAPWGSRAPSRWRNMFQFYAEDSARFTAARDLRFVRQLNPELQSFGDWLAVHKSEITLG